MMVALASSGVRLTPKHAEHDAPATTKTKQHVGDDARHRRHAAGRPLGPRAGRGLVGHPLEEAADDLGAVASRNERHDDDEEDAEGPDDEIGDGRRGVRADAELGQEGVVEPAPALVDRGGTSPSPSCPGSPGHGPPPGRVWSRPVFCPRIRHMTTLARTHVAARGGACPRSTSSSSSPRCWCPRSGW